MCQKCLSRPKNQKSNHQSKGIIVGSNPAQSTEMSSRLGIIVLSSSPPPSVGVKSSDSDYSYRRAKRFDLQDQAKDLLFKKAKYEGSKDPYKSHATISCLRSRYTPEVSIYKTKDYKKGFYTGLVTCANTWACPVCSQKIQEKRRQEISKGIDWAYKEGYKAVMVTFTFPHGLGDNLADLLEKQSQAFKTLRSGKAWDKFKSKVDFQGLIRSLEVVHGQNGWHPHTHELWFVKSDADAQFIKETTLKRWYNACLKVGLTTEAKSMSFMLHAVDVKDNASNSDYLAKQDSSKHWGVDREIAKGNAKSSKGKHPFSLLEDSINGDGKAGEIYLAYVEAMKRKRQIYWSTGLKDKVGLNEITDEEIAEETEKEFSILVGLLDADDWTTVVQNRLRSKVLEVAESQGIDEVRAMLEKVRKDNISYWLMHAP